MSELACPRAGKWIGGCRFEARHEYGASRPASFGWGFSVADQERLMKASKPWIYVRDVCRTCGRTIERTTDLGRSTLAEEGGGR